MIRLCEWIPNCLIKSLMRTFVSHWLVNALLQHGWTFSKWLKRLTSIEPFAWLILQSDRFIFIYLIVIFFPSTLRLWRFSQHFCLFFDDVISTTDLFLCSFEKGLISDTVLNVCHRLSIILKQDELSELKTGPETIMFH